MVPVTRETCVKGIHFKNENLLKDDSFIEWTNIGDLKAKLNISFLETTEPISSASSGSQQRVKKYQGTK
ncbi:MAG: hypothetical protein CBB92_04195 [Flammeovirgaceae bacterium TMED32]|nr:MAG: hypothetical protein CBB92_04195 [Flammeovirgaceae bacterium TMED32]